MGQLRTGNKRRSRAIAAALVQTKAETAPVPTTKAPKTAKAAS